MVVNSPGLRLNGNRYKMLARRGGSPNPVALLSMLAVLTAFMVSGPAIAQAQTRPSAQSAVQVSAQVEGANARLRFAFPRSGVSAQGMVRDRILIIQFDREVTVDPDRISAALPSHVVLAQMDPGGQVLRIALKRDLEALVRSGNGLVTVDLYTPGNTPLPPDPDLDLARPAEPGSALSEAPAAPAPQQRPPSVAPPRETPRNSAPAPQAPSQSQPRVRDDQGAVRLSVSRSPGQTTLTFDWAEPTAYQLEQSGNGAVLTFSRLGRIDLGPVTNNLPPGLRTLEERDGDGGLRLGLTLQEGAALRHSRDGSRIVLDILFTTDEAQNPPTSDELPEELPEVLVPLAKLAQEQDQATRSSGEPESDASGSARLGELSVQSKDLDEGAALVFDWKQSRAGGVVLRGETVWIAFDGAASLDLSAIEGRFPGWISDIEAVEARDLTLLRMEVRTGALVSVTREGPQWTVLVDDSIREPARPLSLEQGVTEDGQPVVKVPLPKPLDAGAVRIVSFKDTVAGDRILAALIDASPHALASTRRHLEFDMLASAHGIFVDPLADDIEMTVADGAVFVSRPGGLALSGPDGRTQGEPRQTHDLGPGFMDVEAWALKGARGFSDAQALIQRRIFRAATPEARRRAHFGLAQFYIAHDLDIEALGILAFMAGEDGDVFKEPAFRALRGVARVKAGRTAAALEDLGHRSLQFDPGAALWRAVAHAEMENWSAARTDFKAGATVLNDHAPKLLERFWLANAASAIGVNDIGAAEEALQKLRQGARSSRVQAETRLLKGQLAEALGQSDAALEHYRAVSEHPFRPAAARAAYRLVSLERKLEQITAEEVIDRLEQLRYQWRGDELELQVLHDLGRIHVESGDIRKGLTVMRQAVQNFPGTDGGREVAQTMSDIFADLYLEGNADRMSPVQALALFYDFPELVPIGRRGDEMIRKLSDRLVDVDLLEQAAELLDHQIRHRLRGVARAQVATRLAMVQLMDRKPSQVIRTLRDTRQTQLPNALNRQRRLLEARALAGLERFDHALEVLEGYGGLDVKRLRADILWQARRWEEAAAAIEDFASELSAQGPENGGSGNAGSGEELRFQVLRAAIALTFAEDGEGLARLRQQFSAIMAPSPDASAFDMVTKGIETEGVAFRELAARIASTNTLDAFMNSLRGRTDAQ